MMDRHTMSLLEQLVYALEEQNKKSEKINETLTDINENLEKIRRKIR